MPFHGFGDQDFMTREDKGSFPLVSRVMKRQSSYQQPRVLYRWAVQVLPWIMGSTVLISSFLARVKRVMALMPMFLPQV
jgi:hypothetical protein